MVYWPVRQANGLIKICKRCLKSCLTIHLTNHKSLLTSLPSWIVFCNLLRGDELDSLSGTWTSGKVGRYWFAQNESDDWRDSVKCKYPVTVFPSGVLYSSLMVAVASFAWSQACLSCSCDWARVLKQGAFILYLEEEIFRLNIFSCL